MTDLGLHAANAFFYGFHTILILFNLFGWLYVRTRRLHLITILATFGSWGLLGAWKGWGYCFLTDWHYEVLRRLGEHEMPSSYIALLVLKMTGWLPDPELVNALTVGLAVLAFGGSLRVNLRSGRQREP
ncbi:MAG TPA: DUF2784 domain-containing protein [Eudoraea sp.]|nr:DUF2784 domain-containing protein [Eudoraea sp.]